MRDANLVKCRNSEVSGGVEIDTPLVGRPWPTVVDVAVAILQSLEQSTRLLTEWVIRTIAGSVEPPNRAAGLLGCQGVQHCQHRRRSYSPAQEHDRLAA